MVLTKARSRAAANIHQAAQIHNAKLSTRRTASGKPAIIAVDTNATPASAIIQPWGLINGQGG
jgi:hypothetical protein